MNTMLFREMAAAVETSSLVCIFTDQENTDLCNAGFLGFVSPELVFLKAVSPNGFADGFVIYHTEDIYRVDFDGPYEKKLRQLYALRNQKHHHFAPEETQTLYAWLERLMQENKVVSFSFGESHSVDIQGVIKDLSPGGVSVLQYDDYGNEAGRTQIDLLTISRLSFDSMEEESLGLLHESRTPSAHNNQEENE